MSSIQSLTNHLHTLEERHRAPDKLIPEEYKNFVRDDPLNLQERETITPRTKWKLKKKNPRR